MTTIAIETRGLAKSHARHLALDGIDLGVPMGQVFGCLGPNGAGKATTIRLLAAGLLALLVAPPFARRDVGVH